VVALDLHAHEAVIEHSDGRRGIVRLTPNRPVGAVTRELLQTVAGLVGAVAIDPTGVPYAVKTKHGAWIDLADLSCDIDGWSSVCESPIASYP
jgi:hypothetical protein